MLTQAAHWLALVLTVGAIAGALGAVTARSLYAMCVYLVVAGACAAASVLALGAADAALAQVLVGVAFTPVVLLAVMLLSARATKPRQGARPWWALLAAVATAAAVFWAMPELGPATPVVAAATEGAVAPWLTALIFVAVASCVGLLGYGERGALQRVVQERDE